MTENTPSPLGNVISIDDGRIKNHLHRVVRGTAEETLNALWRGRRIGCAMHSVTSAIKLAAIPVPAITSATQTKAGEVRNVSLLVAIGVNDNGYREILGICEGAKSRLERVP